MKYFVIFDKNVETIFQLQWQIINISDIFLQYLVLYARREFLREILYNNIAIIATQHSKINFVDTFGDFSHTVQWNSLKSVW